MASYYTREGEPMGLMDWAQSFERDDRVIGNTEIGDVRISTVWLGLDHRFGAGPPLIFETMIFGGEHDQWQERYSTEEEARQGHEAAVALVESGTQS